MRLNWRQRAEAAQEGLEGSMRLNWRERLADWISGGAVTRHRESIGFWRRCYEANTKTLLRGWADRERYEGALNAIAAMETPYANATVRRMAKAAREALE